MWGALCSQKGRGEKKGVWVPLWNTLQIYAVTCWNMSRDVSLCSWRHHVTCIPHHLMALRVPTPVSDQLFVNILYLFCSNCDKVPFMVVSKFLYLHRLVSMLCSIFRQVFLLLVHSVYLFVSVHNWYFLQQYGWTYLCWRCDMITRWIYGVDRRVILQRMFIL